MLPLKLLTLAEDVTEDKYFKFAKKNKNIKMKNKVLLINGLMFGVVLYLLIDRHKKKKPCTCKETETSPTIVATKDPVLESTNVIEPAPNNAPCREAKPFMVFYGEDSLLIDWIGTYPRSAGYKMRLSGGHDTNGNYVFGWSKIGMIPKYTQLTPEQYEEYCKGYRAGTNTTPNLDILPDPFGFREKAKQNI